jgi:hypothetical protein
MSIVHILIDEDLLVTPRWEVPLLETPRLDLLLGSWAA